MGYIDELKQLRVIYLKTFGEDLKAAFVIDGRHYSDPEDVKRDMREAWDELETRRIVAEFESHPIDPSTPPSDLPTWQEFKRRFLSNND